MKKIFYSIFVSAISLVALTTAVQAEQFFLLEKIDYPVNETKTLVSPAGEMSLNFSSDGASGSIIVRALDVVGINRITAFYDNLPEATPASDIYFIQIDKKNKESGSILLNISLKYQPGNQKPSIYIYSEWTGRFEPASADINSQQGIISFSFPENVNYITFGLFNEPLTTGLASWYVHPKYPTELMAASTIFAQNSKVLVTNPNTQQSVIVTIKDYGPKQCSLWTEKEQRLMGPCQDRILDLSKIAFAKIGNVRDGLITVIAAPVTE